MSVFSIKSGRRADIKRHLLSKKHIKLCPEASSYESTKNQLDNSVGSELDENNILAFSLQDDVTRAETLGGRWSQKKN